MHLARASGTLHRHLAPGTDSALQASTEVPFGVRLQWQDSELASSTGAIDAEVPTVEGEDLRQLLALRDSHQGRIGKVHRQVAIYFSISSRIRGASASSSRASVRAPISSRLHRAFCPRHLFPSRYMASVNAGQTVINGSRSRLSVATHVSWCGSPASIRATSGPASTSTAAASLLSHEVAEDLAGRLRGSPARGANDADDVGPAVKGPFDDAGRQVWRCSAPAPRERRRIDSAVGSAPMRPTLVQSWRSIERLVSSSYLRMTNKYDTTYFEDTRGHQVFNAPLDVILADDDVVQPDLIVVAERTRMSRRGIDGAPLGVVEILSPSRVEYDYQGPALRGTRRRALDSGSGGSDPAVLSLDRRQLLSGCRRRRSGSGDAAGVRRPLYSPRGSLARQLRRHLGQSCSTLFPTCTAFALTLSLNRIVRNCFAAPGTAHFRSSGNLMRLKVTSGRNGTLSFSPRSAVGVKLKPRAPNDAPNVAFTVPTDTNPQTRISKITRSAPIARQWISVQSSAARRSLGS